MELHQLLVRDLRFLLLAPPARLSPNLHGCSWGVVGIVMKQLEKEQTKMKKLLAAGAVAAMVLLGGAAAPAMAVPDVCDGGDSGKIDVSGDPESVTVYAPDGKVITAYCVKAGQLTEVVYVSPVTVLTITPTNGKDISHYSVWYDEGGYQS
ncbi:hypothetical protein ACFWIX_11415 [Pseudarthrobacter sp. NPDC058362]|uniref:hypothetical protein n=1 Tax=Pseudarthrobacter sp. NPDC058362 TaxID=3346458 RepID=UPI00365B8D61